MKTLILLSLIILSGTICSAQAQSPIPKINQQITDYFNSHPREKVFLMTDKVHYKPGETIWFRAFVADINNQPVPLESSELFVMLYDKSGKAILQDVYRLTNGSASGDMLIPDNLAEDNYFLASYSSTISSVDELTCIPIHIDPFYSNQMVVETLAKDSIFISGQKNEIYVLLRDISGEIQKNTSLKYQLVNGSEIIDKGKVKTDEKGKATIQLTIPGKTNGEPFICSLSDGSGQWQHEVFLPTNLDPIVVKLFPEGGTLIPGTPAKIGFTAFNKWGLPVDLEGFVQNQDGQSIAIVKTFTKGLGLFSVTNDGQQKYKLVISGKTGQNQSIDIPAPNAMGMALSVIKTDAAFISANLIFADKMKHPVAITVNQGNTIYWGGDLEINGTGRIKIPTDNLPTGMNLLSVFSQKGDLLAERIVYADKDSKMKIEVQPEKTILQSNQSMKFKVRLTDVNNKPLTGNIGVTVYDKFRSGPGSEQIDKFLMIGSELETPFSVISRAFPDKISNSPLLDAYLISNSLKGFSWDKIRQNSPGNALDKNFETQTSEYIGNYAKKFSLLSKDQIAGEPYFSNNEDLFSKSVRQVKTNTTSLDFQRKLLSSSTNLLEVIKTIKPFSIKNNQIVFIGSSNSLFFQQGALLVIDGVQIGNDISSISGISPLEVDHLNISTNPADIHRYSGVNSVGVIEIFMKNGKIAAPLVQKESTNKYDDGYRVPNKFSSVPTNPKQDKRTTLLWVPEQKVDDSGVFEFTVTAGKVISDFNIEVQGVSLKGLTGSGMASFTVTK
jgi:hypothetical protein